MNRLPFKVIADSKDKPLIEIHGEWGSEKLYPEEALGQVLKKIKESQIKFLLRCEDGGSCSRGRLRGLPDGKVHWKVGNCLLFSFLL